MKTFILLVLSATIAFGQAPRPPVDHLSQLLDVHLTSPTNGEVLTYDSGTSKWIDSAAAGGSILIGNSIFVDAVNGNNGTGTRGRLDKPFLTISAAIAVATSGDVILVGPGTFTENSGIIVPANVSLIGSGIDRTKIESTVDANANNPIVKLSSSCVLANLTITGTAAAGVFQYPISNNGASTNVLVYSVKTNAGSDGAFITGNNVSTFTFYDCIFLSRYDCVSVFGNDGNTVELYNCRLIGTGPWDATDHEATTGIYAEHGIARMFGGTITISGGDTANRGANATNSSSVVVELHNVRLNVSGTSATDLVEANSAKLQVNNVVRSDGSHLTYSGTITGIDYIWPRVLAITSSATPAINTGLYDAVTITALAADITSMTSSLSGAPNNFDHLIIRFKDNGSPRAITWGASFVSGQTSLPTTTVTSKVLNVGLQYDSVKSKWVCLAADQEP